MVTNPAMTGLHRCVGPPPGENPLALTINRLTSSSTDPVDPALAPNDHMRAPDHDIPYVRGATSGITGSFIYGVLVRIGSVPAKFQHANIYVFF